MKKRICGRTVTALDTETGEILFESDGNEIVLQDSSLTPDQVKAQREFKEYQENHIMDFMKGCKFVKLYINTLFKISKKLSYREYYVFTILSKFIDYETCGLIIKHSDNKHYMTRNELAELLGIEIHNFNKVMRDLMNKGLIGEIVGETLDAEQNDKYFIINPNIYMKGNNPAKEVYEYFEKTPWKELLKN